MSRPFVTVLEVVRFFLEDEEEAELFQSERSYQVQQWLELAQYSSIGNVIFCYVPATDQTFEFEAHEVIGMARCAKLNPNPLPYVSDGRCSGVDGHDGPCAWTPAFTENNEPLICERRRERFFWVPAGICRLPYQHAGKCCFEKEQV